MQGEISQRFHALAILPENQIGLAEGALVLAAEARPELDLDFNLGVIDELVERAKPLVDAATTPSQSRQASCHSRPRQDQQAVADQKSSREWVESPWKRERRPGSGRPGCGLGSE